MDSLRSSVFSAEVATSTCSSLSSSSSFRIYQDPTISEQILDFLEYGYTVTINKIDTTESNCKLYEKNCYLTLIVNPSDILKFIPIIEHSISFTTHNTKSIIYKPSRKNPIKMILTKVGQTTSEIILQIYGICSIVNDFIHTIVKFSGKQSREEQYQMNYKIRCLINRELLFSIGSSKNDYSLKEYDIKSSLTPYHLFPGYIVEIKSCGNFDEMVKFLMDLFKDLKVTEDQRQTNITHILSFLNPEANRCFLKDDPVEQNSYVVLSEEELENSQQEPVMKRFKKHIPIYEKETCHVLQLTKKEVTYLIGKSGIKIKRIRETTRANIKVIPINTMNLEQMAIKGTGRKGIRSNVDVDVVQFIRISGGVGQVKEAMAIIEMEIYNFRMDGLSA